MPKVIAIDLDDVLSETNATITSMHNELFGLEPPLELHEFHHYLYWMNRGWGDPDETVQMVGKLYAQGLYMRSTPVPGAFEQLQRLKTEGFQLILVTARSERQREGTEQWLDVHFPGVFHQLHFTGAFAHLEKEHVQANLPAGSRSVVTQHKRSKAEIIHSTGALLLVDDSIENAEDCSRADPAVTVLLFGKYPWNRVAPSRLSHPDDHLPYSERKRRGVLSECKARRDALASEGWLPPTVTRVEDWPTAVTWIISHHSSESLA